MLPLILDKVVNLRGSVGPREGDRYDPKAQLWMRGDIPLVVAVMSAAHGRSDFGESIRTATGEGTDQSERVGLSDFGETEITDSGEGADQSEVSAILCSDFGETMQTRTSEGLDQSEVIRPSDFGETTLTETGEGSDVCEVSWEPALDSDNHQS